MRVLVFFDLPTETAENKREYRKFRKLLIKNGFLMMQESVYCRMLLTPGAGTAVLNMIRKNRPADGIVQVMTVTEKQFAGMEYITGEQHSEIIENDERLIVL
ncbi:MAG: CRISPR-associated endonuclease Cas2 [Oscillospiraceae bacterium]|nr:CRISPR-associated endonuclease Cas2 [Oscillospiraceae bacterium]